MGNIYRAARLVMCDCGLHGRIVFSDGSESVELAYRSVAKRTITAARKEGKLVDEEQQHLQQQVDDHLPTEAVVDMAAKAAGQLAALFETGLNKNTQHGCPYPTDDMIYNNYLRPHALKYSTKTQPVQ
jgi:GTPase Era involved in 16S rRNA processing